jgi:hypothetical protein
MHILGQSEAFPVVAGGTTTKNRRFESILMVNAIKQR